jgi:hypothetical protein
MAANSSWKDPLYKLRNGSRVAYSSIPKKNASSCDEAFAFEVASRAF